MVKDRIYYFFDPLCGWCYGFSPTVKKLELNFGDRFSFSALTGGMIRNDQAQPLSHMSAFIKGAYKTVERHCGVEFGQAFLNRLDEGDIWFGSEPPSLAFVIMKYLIPDKDIELSGKILSLISYEGKAPGEIESYRELVESYSQDFDHFVDLYYSDTMKERMQDEFDVSANLGISGFPALILERDRKQYSLSSGASSYEEIVKLLEAQL
jgi:putative protein-disulfide isomerase